jgi:hypothetical protein
MREQLLVERVAISELKQGRSVPNYEQLILSKIE